MIQGRQQSVSQPMTRCMCRGWKGCQGERLEHRDSSVCLAARSQRRWRPSVSHHPPQPATALPRWPGPALSPGELSSAAGQVAAEAPCLSFPAVGGSRAAAAGRCTFPTFWGRARGAAKTKCCYSRR